MKKERRGEQRERGREAKREITGIGYVVENVEGIASKNITGFGCDLPERCS